jgi:hypothetical protein
MSPRRYRITNRPDGSTDVTRIDLGCLGRFATVVAVFFAIAAIVALFQAQWSAFGICLLLCGICLPNFAKRRKAVAGIAGPSSALTSVPTPLPASLADELAKLAALHNQGALTDEEFDTIKHRLLSQDRGAPDSGELS